MARARVLTALRKLKVGLENQGAGGEAFLRTETSLPKLLGSRTRGFCGLLGYPSGRCCRCLESKRVSVRASSSDLQRQFWIQLHRRCHVAEETRHPTEEEAVKRFDQEGFRHAAKHEKVDRNVGPQKYESDKATTTIGPKVSEDCPGSHHNPEISSKTPTLNNVLAALNEIGKADDLGSKLSPYEGNISFREGATVMKLLNDKRLCYSFYSWLKQQPNFRPDLASFLTLIRFLVVENKWEKLITVTEDIFHAGFVLDNGVYCRIIREASLNRKVSICERWFQKMKENQCWPDRTTYNTMMHAYVLSKSEKCFQLFEEMKEMGIEPDINTYCHLLNACRTAADSETAHKVFLQMKANGLSPDLVSYSILLDTYGKVGKMEEASALFREMQEAGISPDAKAYNSLLDGFGKAGRMNEAKAIFNEYQKAAGQMPDRIVYWTMLHSYVQAGMMKEALAVKRMMRVANIPVHASCYVILIDGFRRVERWEDGARAFKEMQRYKYPIGESTYELMLKIYSKAGQFVECEKLFDQMMAKGYKDKVDAYEIMTTVYKQTRHISNATRIYDLMKRNNVVPNRFICHNMLHMYAKAGMLPACERIAEEMGKRGISPNRDTFRTLIRGYCVYRHYYGALDMYELMEEAGIKPDYELSELKVEVLLKTGQVPRAEKFVKEMIASGINPNKRVVAEVLRAGGVVELLKPLAVGRKQTAG